MAAFYILRNDIAMLTSHRPVHLILASAIKQIQSGEFEWDLCSYRGGNADVVSPLKEYLLKPSELEICWYEYIGEYQIVEMKRCLGTHYLLLHKDHPQIGLKAVIKRDETVVVQYHGYSLKSEVRRDTPEKKEMFAMSALLMFKFYTNIGDILGNHQSYYDVLFDCNGAMREGVLRPIGYEVILNNEDRWSNKFASETSAKAYKLKMEVASRDVDTAISHVGVHNNDEQDDVIEYTNGDVTMSGQNILESISLPEPDDDECLSSRSSDLTYPDQKNNITVSGLDENSILKGFKTRPRIQVQEGFFEKMQRLDVSEVTPIIEAAIKTISGGVGAYDSIRNGYLDNPIDSILCKISDDKPHVHVPVLASLHEICIAFSINDPDQKRAFVLGGIALLLSFGDDGNSTIDTTRDRQVFGLIQGLAGSGKTYVINSWIALAKCWGHPNAVLCVCITGIAASNLGGRTIASILSSRFRDEMLSVKLLVVDEVHVCICFFLLTYIHIC